MNSVVGRRAAGMIVVGLAFASPTTATGQPSYRVKPSEVTRDGDIAAGNTRRIIQPFENWTTICDEDLKKRQKVCNISQTIVDPAGNTVFSWSLAATRGGAPVMIARAPTSSSAQRAVRLEFGDGLKPIDLSLDTCSADLCLGYLPVGPEMKKVIGKGLPAKVATQAKDGTPVTFSAPLKGLAAALKGLK